MTMTKKRIRTIYKHQIDSDIKNNDIRDQYEFDSDSEKHKNCKRRKLDVSSSDEIEVIRNKTRKKYKRVVFPGQNKDLKELEQITREKSKSNRNKAQLIATTPEKYKENKNNKDNIVLKKSRNLNESKEFLQENHQDSHLGVNECFGFDENIESPKKSSVATPIFFKGSTPNVNSMMLQNVLTPWRFSEIYVKRNPHFITLKESCLPCISQDMVLDHSVVNQFEHSFKSETKRSPAKKAKMSTPKRATVITNYFKSDVENKENSHVSLFDADQLSPIKTSSKSNNNGDSGKRRIFGEKDSNVVSSTPNRNLRKSQISGLEDVIDFGFNSSDESIEASSPKKKAHDKPFRLSVSVNDKKYHRKRRFGKIENAESTVTSDEEGDLSDLETENDKIRLFEDLDTINENIEREAPLKKKKKWLNQTSSKQHKKRKDILSKEEEEDAEKWAAAFNSMCEEIQEFPLQIE